MRTLNLNFFAGSKGAERNIEEEPVIRFDIIGDKYSFKDIKVGMTKEEFTKLYNGNEIFDTAKLQLTNQQIEDQYPSPASYKYLCAKKLLSDLKPKDYYDHYDQATYVSGGVREDELKLYAENTATALGAVILFKDGKVGRIVFGLPTAD